MLWPYHKYLLCTEFSVPQPKLKTALGTVGPSYPLGINSRSPSRDQTPSCSNPLHKPHSTMNTVSPRYPQVSHPQIQPTLDLTALSCIRRCNSAVASAVASADAKPTVIYYFCFLKLRIHTECKT